MSEIPASEATAREAVVVFAQTFKAAATKTRNKAYMMAGVSLASFFAPFLLSMPILSLSSWVIMGMALHNLRKSQAHMQEKFQEHVQQVPGNIRGIVASELVGVEKTLKSMTTEFSKADIKPEKHIPKYVISVAAIIMATQGKSDLTALIVVPAYLYLLIQDESRKTTELVAQADAAIERNTGEHAPLYVKQPSGPT